MVRIDLILILILGVNQVLYSQSSIILDTDLDSDVDDVGAMAMLHTLADHKKVDILGVIVTSDDKYSPLCADAINHFYGRPDIPIGVQKGISLRHHSRYTKEISEEFSKELQEYEDASEAVALYRRLLSEQPDSSVTIITIGHLTNLQNLLKSKADTISNLTGAELVQKKVKLWSCMGGKFPSGKEANFYRPDPESTQYCITNWPSKVVFAGWEIGNEVITGGSFLKKYLSVGHPVWRAYELYNNFKGRQSWDQVSILYSITGNDKYWNVNSMGYCRVNSDGSNHWIEDDRTYGQGHLTEKENPDEVAKIIDALMVGIYSPDF